MRHLSVKLVDELDAAVGIALDRVQDGDVERCAVAVTFTAGYDKAGNLIVIARIRDGGTKQHSWNPTPRGQGAFADLVKAVEEDESLESVTFATPGREPVTLGRKRE
jgi:hypothetical protein